MKRIYQILTPIKSRQSRNRRCRAIRELILDIFTFKGNGRSYTPLACAACASLIFLAIELKNSQATLLISVTLFSILSYAALFDIKYYIIPNSAIYFLGVMGLASVILIIPSSFFDRIFASLLSYALIYLIQAIYEYIRGVPGLGLGDTKLISAGALWLGLKAIPGCIIIAAISALVSIIISVQQDDKKTLTTAIPFGPHIALAIWLTWAVGPLELN